MPATTLTAPPVSLRPRLLLNGGLAIVMLLALGFLVLRPHAPAASPAATVPQSAQLEARTGVRFSRVAVVGDGGLVTLFYVVLDTEKATSFQADREHAPRLTSEDRDGGTDRASIMRAGHQMRAGQTYYFVYEDTGGSIRSGDHVTISYGGMSLRHVPVL